MKIETRKRLQASSTTEQEKRLDEINWRLEITQLVRSAESFLDETEEREWLKRKLGYRR